MRFSLYINPQTRGPDDDRAVIDAVTRQAIEADRSGFAAVFLTEHHFTGYNAFSDPFVFGAYLAPQLRRAWLGLSVAVPPLHHPLKLVEECNLLDNLTRGRVVIGVGAGGGPLELAGFGLEPNDRRAATEQVLDVAMRAWARRPGDPPLDFETLQGRGRMDGRIIPSSYRKPHPLIARACVSDASILTSARRGWPVLLGRFGPERIAHQLALHQEALRAAGHPPGVIAECSEWSAMLKLVYVAETDEQARRDVAEPVDNYLHAAFIANSADRLESEVSRLDGPIRSAATTPEKRADFLARAMIWGSPETVAARLRPYAEVGVSNMMLWFTWGYNDPAKVQRSLRLFVDEVMPRFATAAPAS
jgi:alkanesulfonate monooxygenase SsuD/methylene tetrahydromethanopterin reductase-like flavin-dependent oxidoreductase (luciferase family)